MTGLTLRFGFLDEVDVPAALRHAVDQHLIDGEVDIDDASDFLFQTAIVPTDAPGMSSWRKRLYHAMAQNAADPAECFGLPDNQAVAMGGRIQL